MNHSYAFARTAEILVKNFDGNLPVELLVFRQINLAHSARADLLHDLVVSERTAFFESFVIAFNQRRDSGNGRCLKEAFPAVGRKEKRFDLSAKLNVSVAFVSEKARALVRRHLQRIVEKFLHLLPLRGHLVFIPKPFILSVPAAATLWPSANRA